MADTVGACLGNISVSLGSIGGGEGKRGGEATGKVNGVVYDRFGDFEGFPLLTEEGHERAYRSHEAEIEALARYAWAERVVITVLTDANKPDVPVSIILLTLRHNRVDGMHEASARLVAR